ncbi:MAG: hypothetical protein MHM6MM_001421 [Cercozoa sp. M6MM]
MKSSLNTIASLRDAESTRDCIVTASCSTVSAAFSSVAWKSQVFSALKLTTVAGAGVLEVVQSSSGVQPTQQDSPSALAESSSASSLSAGGFHVSSVSDGVQTWTSPVAYTNGTIVGYISATLRLTDVLSPAMEILQFQDERQFVGSFYAGALTKPVVSSSSASFLSTEEIQAPPQVNIADVNINQVSGYQTSTVSGCFLSLAIPSHQETPSALSSAACSSQRNDFFAVFVLEETSSVMKLTTAINIAAALSIVAVFLVLSLALCVGTRKSVENQIYRHENKALRQYEESARSSIDINAMRDREGVARASLMASKLRADVSQRKTMTLREMQDLGNDSLLKVTHAKFGTMASVLADETSYTYFTKYLVNEFSQESMMFFEDVQRIKRDYLISLFRLREVYLLNTAKFEVNIPGKIRNSLLRSLHKVEDVWNQFIDPEERQEVFSNIAVQIEAAAQDIFSLLERDSFRRFLTSDLARELLEAKRRESNLL